MGRGCLFAIFRKGVALFFWTGFFLRESWQGAKKKDDKEMSHHQRLSGFVAGCKPAGKFLAFLGILDRAERNLADLEIQCPSGCAKESLCCISERDFQAA